MIWSSLVHLWSIKDKHTQQELSNCNPNITGILANVIRYIFSCFYSTKVWPYTRWYQLLQVLYITFNSAVKIKFRNKEKKHTHFKKEKIVIIWLLTYDEIIFLIFQELLLFLAMPLIVMKQGCKYFDLSSQTQIYLYFNPSDLAFRDVN